MFLRNRCRSGGQGPSWPIIPPIGPKVKPLETWAGQISSHYKGLAAAITERLTLTSCGIFEALTPESTKVVTEVRRHAGITRVVRFSFGLKGSLIVRLGFTQHPLAIPFDASFKRVDGTVRANLSFLAVALHQLERAVAPSHREAKVI